MANLALVYERIERAERLFDRCDGVVAVDLVEIDVADLKSAKASFDSVHDVSADAPTSTVARASGRPSVPLTKPQRNELHGLVHLAAIWFEDCHD